MYWRGLTSMAIWSLINESEITPFNHHLCHSHPHVMVLWYQKGFKYYLLQLSWLSIIGVYIWEWKCDSQGLRQEPGPISTVCPTVLVLAYETLSTYFKFNFGHNCSVCYSAMLIIMLFKSYGTQDIYVIHAVYIYGFVLKQNFVVDRMGNVNNKSNKLGRSHIDSKKFKHLLSWTIMLVVRCANGFEKVGQFAVGSSISSYPLHYVQNKATWINNKNAIDSDLTPTYLLYPLKGSQG